MTKTTKNLLVAAAVLWLGIAAAFADDDDEHDDDYGVRFIEASAHNAGAGGTLWVTDARVFNPDAVREIEVALAFLPAKQDNSHVSQTTVSIPPRHAVALDDLVASLFGRSDAGAIRLSSEDRFIASSRTYNLGDGHSGTFGQYVEAVSAGAALGHAILLQLANQPGAAGFRTNVGFVNPEDEPTSVTLRVFDLDSASLIGEGSVALEPFGYEQVNNVFAFVGAENSVVHNASVEVASQTRLLVYASVVDNTSGDAIFIRAVADEGTPVTMNNPPQGTISQPAADLTIDVGQSVVFAGSASDPDGDQVTVLWEFGDGMSSTELAPGAHTFAVGGSFTVTFTATDDQGLADPTPATRTIMVQAGNSAPNGTITQPTGNITINPGESVFFAGAISDPDGDQVTVRWEFGDGISASQLEPGNHTYTAGGTYTVTFTATDDRGLADPSPATRVVNVVAASTTLTQIQSEVFTPRCASCHGGGSPDAGLNLQSGRSWSNLVNVPATTRPGVRVVPFDPNGSALVKKLEGGHRSLGSSLINMIRDWIGAGAENN